MVERWDSEVKRLQNEVDKGVVDPQVLLESTNQLKSSTAARKRRRRRSPRPRRTCCPTRPRSPRPRSTSRSHAGDLSVAESEAKRIKAWVGYLTLTAPFDGVIMVRNANTFDFVLPATGDPTAMERSPNLSPGGAAPIYVVDRTDIVRIFVDIPEQDANYVHVGTKATVLAKGLPRRADTRHRHAHLMGLECQEPDTPCRDRPAEPHSQLLPGMYAYAKVIIERPGVRALPLSALTHTGEKTYCWKHENGKAVRAEIQTGVSDGEWIEVTNYQVPRAANGTDPWSPVNGSEQVILGDLSILADGGPVEVVPATEKLDEKVASATAEHAPAPASADPKVSVRVD